MTGKKEKKSGRKVEHEIYQHFLKQHLKMNLLNEVLNASTMRYPHIVG